MSSSFGSFSANKDGSGYFPHGGQPSAHPNYASWTWKQIEAAILGGSQIPPGTDGQQTAQGFSDPTTLWATADALELVRQTLNMVGQALQDQGKALAGGQNPPWKGEAANAFYDTMTVFSQQVAANAQVLNAPPTAATLPQQLVDSGNDLALAQEKIKAIDSWYANEAVQLGAPVMSEAFDPRSA